MRAGVAVFVAATCLLPRVARTQPDAPDADIVLDIPLHPDIMTVLQLPEAVVSARTLHRDEFQIGFFASRIYVQPRPDTSAGTEALLEVETTAQQQRFRLRVVEHADDAARMFLVRARNVEQGARDARPVVLPELAPEPASAPPSLPSEPPPPRLPDAGRASTPEPAGPAAGHAVASVRSPGFELSVHTVVALAGTTALMVPGYEPIDVRKSHRAFGLRIAGRPRDRWWAVEGNVSGEWLVGPTVHTRGNAMQPEVIQVSGPLLRMDAGLRARFGAPWSATAYAGIGLQAHHLDIDVPMAQRDGLSRDMLFGGTLALGMGLGYRTGKILLGLELHMRQGVPDDYRSVSALLSVGCFLDQEKEP